MKIEKGKILPGEFKIGEYVVAGDLTIADGKSNLYAHSPEFFLGRDMDHNSVLGILRGGSHVSLINCLIPPIPGTHSSPAGRSYFSDIYPHYVLVGRHHLDEVEQKVVEICWRLEELHNVFYDFDAYGSSDVPEKYIGDLVADTASKYNREIPVGEHPQILYYTGRHELFRCDLEFGTLRVTHGLHSFMGQFHTSMSKRLYFRLAFAQPAAFFDTWEKVGILTSLLEIIIGRSQVEKKLYIGTTDEPPTYLRVYPSFKRKVRKFGRDRHVSPHDVMIDGLKKPEILASIIKHWFATQSEMGDARGRFQNSFRKENYYSIDRVIAAANLFDLIPDRHFPKKVELPECVVEAVKACTTIFEALPESSFQKTILVELSKLGASKLKEKVKVWAKDLISQSAGVLDEIEYVIDRAINCRNYFVHGGKSEFKYLENTQLLSFLVRTLEFCYALPELMRGGLIWDYWLRTYRGGNHPFSSYVYEYADCLKLLQKEVAAHKEAVKLAKKPNP
ncbi:ApeA N-terminal domain 1-containing protein [Asticcacaulis sp. AC460]|uniref:ApeA N-terminal domain 1-containing protein n=1 Tax=Asticcacaulis sp. AC460 TaxID=1282360 RepID=UPI0012DD317E|nr:HEPN domain-containing protein [Asticcacaulis sp. AC460]